MIPHFPEFNPTGVKMIAKRISNSKKEIEITVVSHSPNAFESGVFPLFIPGEGNSSTPVKMILQSINTVINNYINESTADAVIDVGSGKYIPIVNALFSEDQFAVVNSADRDVFVIKTNEPLPSSFKKLSTINIKIIHSELVSEALIYAGDVKEPPKPFGAPLTTDYTFKGTNPYNSENLNFESFNDMSSSAPSQKVNEVISGSYHSEIQDFSAFEKFAHFSSVEKRLINFKQKLTDIQTNLSAISASLIGSGQLADTRPLGNSSNTLSHLKNLREEKFNKAHQIINNFTTYEKFLYYDNQKTNSGSAPGLGQNFAKSFALSPGKEKGVHYNNEGFDTTFIISSSESSFPLTSNEYKVEEYPFFNNSGSFYLSFIMRASKSFSDSIVFQNFQTSSVPKYPQDSLHSEIVSRPVASGSQFHRYVFKASASYWEPSNNNITPGLQYTIDWGTDSDDYRILSGSNITGSGEITAYGMYSDLTAQVTGSGLSHKGSFVPKGDLFNIRVKGLPAGGTGHNAIITDFKLTTKEPDNNYLPFSYLPNVDSTEFLNWYNDIITSAKSYDERNVFRLLNNLPSTYQKTDETTNSDLRDYVDMIGEFFDEYKALIDDYYRIFNQGFSDYETLPNKFNSLLSSWIGFDIIQPQSGSILDNFGLDSFSSETRTKFHQNLANRLLNNISYLYKTKGTQNSIKALLNIYGLPSNVLRLRESGASTKTYYDTILSNDVPPGRINISSITGSISFAEKTDSISTIIPHPDMSMSIDWNDGKNQQISSSAFEGLFKLFPTKNTQSLAEDRADNDSDIKWRLMAMQSSSNQPNFAKIKFEINKTTDASASIDTRNEYIETDYLNIMDNSLINIVLQKSSSGHNVVSNHNYELIVGKSIKNEIHFIHKSNQLTTDGSSGPGKAINKNFLSGSEKRLRLAHKYTGSLGQIKAWKEPLSIGAFKQHLFNKKSKVGNSLSSSIDELNIDLTMDENYESGSDKFILYDHSNNLPGYNGNQIDLDVDLIDSMNGNPFDTDIISVHTFGATGQGLGTLEFTDNNIIINDNFELKENLSYKKSSLASNHKVAEKDFIHTNKLEFARSPQEVINDFILDNVGNYDFNDLIADPRDDFADSYKDLKDFNEKVLKKNNVSVDVNKFIRATSKIFKSNVLESVTDLLPARARVVKGTILKPTLTERIKFPPLASNPDVEHIHKEETDILGDITKKDGELVTPPEYTFDNISKFDKDVVYGYDAEAGEMNIYNQLGIPERRKRPELTWGTTTNDTHFISKLQLGINNDGNTYHNEERAVFEMIGDTESTSGSKIGKSHIYHLNYEDANTFDNKKIIKTSEAVGKRDLGTTLQFIDKDTPDVYGLLMDDYRLPTNHVATYVEKTHYQLNRGFFVGYKLHAGLGTRGQQTSLGALPFNLTWTTSGFFPRANSNVSPPTPGLEWTDLSTASFYTINLEQDTTNRLKIVRTENEPGVTT